MQDKKYKKGCCEGAKVDKERYIKQEITKYKKMFKDINGEKKPIAEKMYNQAAFMSVTLYELQEIVKAEGAIIEMINGNGIKTVAENPAQKSYNIMIKNYNAVIKILIDLLPEGEGTGDELMGFLRGDKK